MQVDVGVVGVPGEDDAHVERQVPEQARVDRGRVDRLAVTPGLVDDGVELGEGDQVDVGEAPIPRAGDDGVKAIDRPLRLAGIGEREAEIAVRLRSFGASSRTRSKTGSAVAVSPACCRR